MSSTVWVLTLVEQANDGPFTSIQGVFSSEKRAEAALDRLASTIDEDEPVSLMIGPFTLDEDTTGTCSQCGFALYAGTESGVRHSHGFYTSRPDKMCDFCNLPSRHPCHNYQQPFEE